MTEDTKFLISLAQWVLLALAGLYTWLSNRQKASDKDLGALSDRVTRLEEQMRHLPDQALVNELAGDMKAVKSELTGIRESIAPLARSMDRINDYLLNNK